MAAGEEVSKPKRRITDLGFNYEEKMKKIYHGTSESIAKLACVKGLHSCEKSGVWSVDPGICLTTAYPGLMAFNCSFYKEKWGLIEIDHSTLHSSCFSPHDVFLLEKSRKGMNDEKLSVTKMKNQKKWKESLEKTGLCIYNESIPLSSITRVSIYDPQSNLPMTKIALNVILGGGRFHERNIDRHQMLVRWMMGENVTFEEWVGKSKVPHSEKDRISQMLHNKYGLDIFYYGSTTVKKGNKAG